MARTISPDWTVDDAAIICSEPIDGLIDEMKRRHRERSEERPGEQPVVALSWVLNQVTEARRQAVKLDHWLDLATIADIGDCSYETARRKAANLPDAVRRQNRWNGKVEVHVETVAGMLDMPLEDVEAERDCLPEVA